MSNDTQLFEAPEPEAAGSVRPKGRRLLAGIAIGSALLVVAAIGAALMTSSPASRITNAEAPPPSVITAPVEHRVLEARLVVRGTVAQGASVDVAGDIEQEEGGTSPVVTRVPLRAGAVVRPGAVLMEISGRPIFLLRGKIPVYRDLRPGATGNDVAQLQRALRGLGQDVTDPPGTYGPSTKHAVDGLYRGRGYDALPASAEDRETVRAGEDAVTAARRARDQAARELRAGKSPVARDALRYAEEDLARAQSDLDDLVAHAGPMVPAGEVVFVSAPSARVAAVTVRVGQRVSGPVARLESGQVYVRTAVRASQRSAVRPGMPVQVLAETSGIEARGTVSVVGADPDPEGLFGVRATLVGGYDPQIVGQEVRITFSSASTAGAQLVVPLSAVSARADGSTVVVAYRKGEQVTVPVRTDISSGGFVTVSPTVPGALETGDRVIVGRR